MPPPLRRPVMPPGNHARFVNVLFWLFRKAGRPNPRVIAQRIRERDELAGTASHETIRRVLGGHGIPAHWSTVQAIVLVLCEMADTDPAMRWVDYDEGPQRTRSLHDALRDMWNDALDDPVDPEPVTTPPSKGDPFDDEPPF